MTGERFAGALSELGSVERCLAARYDPRDFVHLIRFVHSWVGDKADVDVYNVHYEGGIASAAVHESIEDVVGRLGSGVTKLILPAFAGGSLTVRVDHSRACLEARATTLDVLEELSRTWVSFMGSAGTIIFSLIRRGRCSGSRRVTRLVHFFLQVAAVGGAGAIQLRKYTADGGVARDVQSFELPDSVVPCSDCGGYHAPLIAERIRRSIDSTTVGIVDVGATNELHRCLLTLRLPGTSFELVVAASEVSHLRDVEEGVFSNF